MKQGMLNLADELISHGVLMQSMVGSKKLEVKVLVVLWQKALSEVRGSGMSG